MSEIQKANGGDGWSSWTVERRRDTYLVVVTSSAERTAHRMAS